MTESRSINHMKCYVFRMAQEKWNMAPSMTAKLFNENKLFDYIEECYDSLHLSSYQLVLKDLETILENHGVTGWSRWLLMDKEIREKQKNAAAIMLMQRVLEIYSERHSVSIDQALTWFSSTSVYNALFDYETGLWKEGPDYILDLLEKDK